MERYNIYIRYFIEEMNIHSLFRSGTKKNGVETNELSEMTQVLFS